MAYLRKGNRLIASVPVERLAHWFLEQEERAEDFEIELQAEEKRALVRKKLFAQGGDVQSFLGTTSDIAHLLFHSFCQLIVALHTAEDMEQVRAAARPFASWAAGFLASVEAGEVKLPFAVKGLDSVIADIGTRATIVTDAISSSRKRDSENV